MVVLYLSMLVFQFTPIKKLKKKLDKLNESLTKTYYLEEEILMHGLFPREMILPAREKAVYRLIEGGDIINYIGHACNYIDDEVRGKIKKLSDISLVKAYEFTKEFASWNNFFDNLSNYLKHELENNGYSNLKHLSLYSFKDDSHLKIGLHYENQ